MRSVCLTALVLAACLPATAWPATAEQASPPSAHPVRVRVSASNPVTLANEGLRIGLVTITDDRCPHEVRCVWEGHAAVTLALEGPGLPYTVVVIGTDTLPDINLSSEAAVG